MKNLLILISGATEDEMRENAKIAVEEAIEGKRQAICGYPAYGMDRGKFQFEFIDADDLEEVKEISENTKFNIPR